MYRAASREGSHVGAIVFAGLIGLFLIVVPALMVLSGRLTLGQDFRTANRDSAGIAPDPAKTPEAARSPGCGRRVGIIDLRGFRSCGCSVLPHDTCNPPRLRSSRS